MGPTPPGTGLNQPATFATSGWTSPCSLLPSRVIPTSTTAAPGLTMSGVTKQLLPIAATSTSASRATAGRSAVLEWQTVTVAFRRRSSRATGLPTISLPAGRDVDGLPLAIQLVGRPWAEAELLAAATWCEEVLDFARIEPPD